MTLQDYFCPNCFAKVFEDETQRGKEPTVYLCRICDEVHTAPDLYRESPLKADKPERQMLFGYDEEDRR